MSTPTHLTRVSRAASKIVAARSELDAAVRKAHDAGGTLRQIAAAAGVSYEQIRRIIARTPTG